MTIWLVEMAFYELKSKINSLEEELSKSKMKTSDSSMSDRMQKVMNQNIEKSITGLKKFDENDEKVSRNPEPIAFGKC